MGSRTRSYANVGESGYVGTSYVAMSHVACREPGHVKQFAHSHIAFSSKCIAYLSCAAPVPPQLPGAGQGALGVHHHSTVSGAIAFYLKCTTRCLPPVLTFRMNDRSFDPDVDWPTDLDCELTWNAGLTSYDGERVA